LLHEEIPASYHCGTNRDHNRLLFYHWITESKQGQETNAEPGIAPIPSQLASNTPTLDENLKELKNLTDSGLISQDVYLER